MAGQAVDMLPEVDPAIGQREAISSAIAAANIAVGAVTDAADRWRGSRRRHGDCDRQDGDRGCGQCSG